MTRSLLLGCILLPSLGLSGEAPKKADSVSFRTYRIPAYHILHPEFSDSTVLDSKLWEEMPVEEVRRRIKTSQVVVEKFLKSEGIEVPKDATALLDIASDTLVVRADSSVHEWLKWFEWDFQYAAPRTTQWRLDIVEAPSADLQTALANRDPLDAAACREKLLRTGKLVTTLRGNGKPGNPQHISSGGSVEIATAYSLKGSIPAPSRTEPLSTGTSFKFDPVFSQDSLFVDITYQLRHCFGPVHPRLESVMTGAPQGNTLSWTDVPVAEVSSAILMNVGATQILGTWKVADNPKASQAAFLQVDYPLVQVPVNPHVLTLLNRHAHEVSPMPDPNRPPQNKPIPKGMERRSYVVPPDFHMLGSPATRDPNPFGPIAPAAAQPVTTRSRARLIFEEQCISFPEGAEARYFLGPSVVKVVNTKTNLDLIEAFLGSINICYKSILVADLTLIEAPADLLQSMDEQLRGSTDHTAALTELTRKGARLVDSANLCCKPGRRMHYRSGIDYRHAAPAKAPGVVDSKVQQVGLELELDPVVGADSETIDINLSYRHDMAPPQHETSHSEKGELTRATTTFYQHQDTTSLTTKTGSTRLVSEWTPRTPAAPTGDQSLRQVLVLKISRETTFPQREGVGPMD